MAFQVSGVANRRSGRVAPCHNTRAVPRLRIRLARLVDSRASSGVSRRGGSWEAATTVFADAGLEADVFGAEWAAVGRFLAYAVVGCLDAHGRELPARGRGSRRYRCYSLPLCSAGMVSGV